MSLARGVVAVVVGAGLIAAVPSLAAQQPSLVVGVYGGQYTHFSNLANTSPSPDFLPGYDLGVTVGFQLTRVVGLHSDVYIGRSRVRGSWTLAPARVDRLLLGEHVELGTDLVPGLRGYVFAGGGMLRVTQSTTSWSGDGFNAWWQLAGTAGAGMFVTIPRTSLDLMLEGRTLVYRFDRMGFDRVQWDGSYGVGVAYRFDLR